LPVARVPDLRPSPHRAPRSALRIPQLLRLLADLPDGATLSRLSKSNGTPKSSLLALLRALTQTGFVQHHDGRYAIGPESIKLASAIAAQRRFPDIALPVLNTLADASGESAFLAQLADDGPEAVYIHRADRASALRFSAEVGSREPLYSSAVGRVLLAFQPEPWRERYLRHVKLVARTPKTVKSKRELRRILERVRRERGATSFEETIDGVAGIAAPVFDGTGNLLAGLVVGAPASRARSKVQILVAQVRDAAREISSLMGYRAPAE
jgi:DNA-binding IclR family transcriptional regulator